MNLSIAQRHLEIGHRGQFSFPSLSNRFLPDFPFIFPNPPSSLHARDSEGTPGSSNLLDELARLHTVVITAEIYYTKGYKTERAEGGTWGQVQEHWVPAPESPERVESYREGLIPAATGVTTHVRFCPPGKLTADSALGLNGGWGWTHPLPLTYQSSRPLGGKHVLSVNHIVCPNSLGSDPLSSLRRCLVSA